MTDSMIERVAKAICCPNGCLAPLDCSIPNKRDIEKAKAAIEAMREPTEAMKHALNKHGDEIHYSYSCQVCGGVAEGYKAMIEAALK